MFAKSSKLTGLSLTLILILALTTSVFASGGSVFEVDKYGNITLDIATEVLLDAGYEFGDLLLIEVGEYKIEAPFVTAYSDVNNGEPLVRGPGGIAESPVIIALNMGNFAGTYEVEAGMQVNFSLVEKEAYLAEWTIRQLERTNNREDYASDEIFANFRVVNLGDLGQGAYYRSSSPANNDLGRAAYVDSLIAAAGVNTVINLADSSEELTGYFTAEDYASPYYKELYDQGQVIFLDMGVDFQAPEFKAKLKDGLEFMSAKPGPYLVHCNEGKDRAGFVAALIEALMGASVTEIKEDYMVTYINYYGVEYGSEQYDKIAESNILESLRDIANLPKGADLTGVDLVAAAENYIQELGLTAEQISSLKDQLSQDQAVKPVA